MKKKDTDSIQFGEGNFMRAFVDYCVQLLNEETDFVGKVNIVPVSYTHLTLPTSDLV